jgi:tetratricopeptide (TPR) repeat protein
MIRFFTSILVFLFCSTLNVTYGQQASLPMPTPTPPLNTTNFLKHSVEFMRLDALLTTATNKVDAVEAVIKADNKKNGRSEYSRPDSDLSICRELSSANELYYKAFNELYEMQSMGEAGLVNGRPDLQNIIDEAEYSIDGIGANIAFRQAAWKCPKAEKTGGSPITATKPDATLTRDEDLAYRTKMAIQQKATDSILAELNDAIAKNKKDALALAMRGDIYMSQEKVEMARLDYNAAIKYDGKNSMYYYKRGKSFESLPNYNRDTANVDYTKALEFDPNNEDALRDRARNYTLTGNNTEAMADLLKAVQLKPNDPKPHLLLAELYVKANDADNALRQFNSYFAVKKDDPYAYVERGQIYEYLKEYVKAEADYDKVIELLPNDVIGYGNRADVYAKAKRFQLAEKDYTKGIDLKKDSSVRYVQRARFYAKWGKYDEALSDYQSAISLDRSDWTIAKEAKDLIATAKLAIANAQALGEKYNPLMDTYVLVRSEISNKMDDYVALKKSSPSEKSLLCTNLSELSTLGAKATAAFAPILEMYEQGQLKGFSGPIDLAEDNKWRLPNTLNYILAQQAELKCR